MLDSLSDEDSDLSKCNPDIILRRIKQATQSEEKIQLWKQLSLAVFSRCITLILGASYLTALTHIQLSILAGYNYQDFFSKSLQNQRNMSHSHMDETKSKKNVLWENSEAQEMFLADGTNTFLVHGVSQIKHFLVTDVIPKLIGNIKLTQFLSLAEVSDLLRSIIRQSISTGWSNIMFFNANFLSIIYMINLNSSDYLSIFNCFS